MIAAAIVCAAALSQVATVRWNSGAVKAPADASGTKSSTLNALPSNMYIITLSSEAYTALAAMSYADASESIWNTYGGDNLPKDPSATITTALGAGYVQTVGDSSGLNYAAAIITYTDDDGNDWYIANIGKANVTGSGQVTVGNLATTFGGTAGGTIGAWTAVPEPTSGLLLLLGVAGLALKRKRA